MSFRFVHAADLHLDTPFEGIGQLNPAVQAALRDASLDAFDDLIDLCLAEDAAFLLIAGDLYDGANRGVRAQLRVRQGVQRLSERGAGVFIIHGNHDPLDGWSAIRDWPPGVHVFASTGVERQIASRDGVPIATIYGMSYPTRDVSENLARRYRRDSSAPVLQIGLLHGTVGTTADHDAYSPCDLADLRAAGMDYWALGHIHDRRILAREPWVVYPGNLQGRSLKPSEQGAKGALVVEVDGGAVREPRFVPLDRVRFCSIETAIDDLADLAALRQALDQRVDAIRAEHSGRGVLLRGVLTGRGPVHADLQRPGAAVELLRELQAGADGFQPFVWWTAIRDQSRSGLDRESIRRRGDFSAELVNRSDAIAGCLPGALASEAVLPPFLRSFMSGLQLELEPWDALLAEAEEAALDLLDVGGE